MWSEPEENQLIGRLRRAGQEKAVHVYKLLLHDTGDTTLADIAFMKGRLHRELTESETTIGKHAHFLTLPSIERSLR